MLNVEVDPAHETFKLEYVGVRVTTEVIGAAPALVPWKTGMVFDPEAANPVFWLLLVQA